MEFNNLLPEYKNGQLVGWFCSKCQWRLRRDSDVPEIDDLARARAEFLNHTCNLSDTDSSQT